MKVINLKENEMFATTALKELGEDAKQFVSGNSANVIKRLEAHGIANYRVTPHGRGIAFIITNSDFDEALKRKQIKEKNQLNKLSYGTKQNSSRHRERTIARAVCVLYKELGISLHKSSDLVKIAELKNDDWLAE